MSISGAPISGVPISGSPLPASVPPGDETPVIIFGGFHTTALVDGPPVVAYDDIFDTFLADPDVPPDDLPVIILPCSQLEGVVPDVTPPTVTVISPAEGTPIATDATLVVEVTDNVAVALAPLYAQFAGQPGSEMVYNGSAFVAPYAALSSVIDLGAGGRRFSLRRTGGWPGDVNITFIPTDTSGNTV